MCTIGDLRSRPRLCTQLPGVHGLPWVHARTPQPKGRIQGWRPSLPPPLIRSSQVQRGKRVHEEKMQGCRKKWKTCLSINMVFSVITQRILLCTLGGSRGRRRWGACLFCYSGWVRLLLTSTFGDKWHETTALTLVSELHCEITKLKLNKPLLIVLKFPGFNKVQFTGGITINRACHCL